MSIPPALTNWDKLAPHVSKGNRRLLAEQIRPLSGRPIYAASKAASQPLPATKGAAFIECIHQADENARTDDGMLLAAIAAASAAGQLG